MTAQESTTDGAGVRGPRADCCRPASHPLADGEVAADVETLAALGSETRYEALRLVADADDAVCVCEVEAALAVSQGAVSQALSRLSDAGLVDRRKEGRWRYYSATPRAERLLAVLDGTREAQGD